MSKIALLFLLAFFAGIIGALFYNGAIAFLAYQIIYFFNPGSDSAVRWWTAMIPELRYSMIIVLLMLVVLVGRYKEYAQSSPWGKLPAFKWMIALLLMYYIAYLFAIDIDMHKRFTFEFAKLVIIVLVAYKLINSKFFLDMCLWTYLVGSTYIGYLAMIKGRRRGRVEGIGMIDSPDANDTAAALVPAGVLLLYFAWQGNKKIKVLAVCMAALIANGLVLINSRGAFLGAVVSVGLFLMYMMFSKYQKHGQRASAILIIVFGLSGAYSLTDDVFWERMVTLTQTEDRAKSGSSRVYYWLATFDMLKEHPLGMGIYGYNRLAPEYMGEEIRGKVEYRSVHSMWFQALGEVGWIGLFIFLGMLYSLWRISSKTKQFLIAKEDYAAYFKLLALECALLGYMAAASFINRFRAEILYWFILFLAVGVKLYYLQCRDAQEVETSARKKLVRD